MTTEADFCELEMVAKSSNLSFKPGRNHLMKRVHPSIEWPHLSLQSLLFGISVTAVYRSQNILIQLVPHVVHVHVNAVLRWWRAWRLQTPDFHHQSFDIFQQIIQSIPQFDLGCVPSNFEWFMAYRAIHLLSFVNVIEAYFWLEKRCRL